MARYTDRPRRNISAQHKNIENGAILGIVALYDKSISVGDIKASIDGHYGKST
jgi:hypothetical protein